MNRHSREADAEITDPARRAQGPLRRRGYVHGRSPVPFGIPVNFVVAAALQCDIATHICEGRNMAMKTTLDISDPLLQEAKKIATRDRTTLRELVEQGLRKVVAERKTGRPFRLRKVTFKGEGLVPELQDADWNKIRDLSYEGRGG
jgi:hypothetical protein